MDEIAWGNRDYAMHNHREGQDPPLQLLMINSPLNRNLHDKNRRSTRLLLPVIFL